MNNKLHQLTVCIFTFNRPEELTRLIKYWSQFSVNLIILDGGQKGMQLENKFNVTYCHVPQLNLCQRLEKFSDMIRTDYVLLSPDDDFFFPDGLNKIIKFLNKNKDYASAQGLRVRFYDYPSFNWIPDYLQQLNLKFISEDKANRLLDMHNSMHFIYSVIRTTDYKKITNCLAGVNSNKRDSMMLPELIFNYTLPVLGKHLIFPSLYSARKFHSYHGSDVKFSNWVNDKNDIDANKFKNNVINFYVKEIGCSVNKAVEYFDHVTKNFSKDKNSQPSKNGVFKSTIKKVFFESKLRLPYAITRRQYFRMYLILVRNNNFLSGMRELNSLIRFLKHNRLNIY